MYSSPWANSDKPISQPGKGQSELCLRLAGSEVLVSLCKRTRTEQPNRVHFTATWPSFTGRCDAHIPDWALEFVSMLWQVAASLFS